MESHEIGTIYKLPLTILSTNPDQPRKVFPEAEIQVLADSIKEKGLLQPILVKELEDGQIQEYLDMLIHKTKAEDLALLHEEILTIRDSIGIIIFKIIDLQNKIDASNKATSPITKRKSLIRINDDDD